MGRLGERGSEMKRNFKQFDWECDTDGCFNKLKRLKFGVLFNCFPGAISFSDVDGIVEIAGNALLLEWKPAPTILQAGQRIMYQRITVGRRFSVIVAAGDASTMTVTHRSGFVNGRWRDWKEATTEELKNALKAWAAWAEKNPRLG